MIDISPLGGYAECMKKSHTMHAHISKRLKRANGHLEKVIRMIDDDSSCLDVAHQLHAVEQAIKQAKKIYIEDHIDHCLDKTTDSRSRNKRKEVQEFKEIAKYL